MPKKIFTILSIEDNLPDFVLLEKALQIIPDLSLNIINILDGKEALDFIFKKNKHASAPTPDLIIIDINLPLIDGLEVLENIKNDKLYKIIPCIMFSTSEFDKDIINSYKLHANSYITKTFDIKDLFKKIAIMGEYWLKTNKTVPPETTFFSKNKE